MLIKTLNMQKLLLVPLLFIFSFSEKTHAQLQPSRIMTLQQVVDLAKEQSLSAKQASTQLENRYWQYRTFKSNYKPQLGLSGTLPDYNRAITPVTQNDGTEMYRRRSLSTSSLDLSLNQNIGLTGGSVFMSSQLQRIDIFGEQRGNNYLANPFVIGFNQPLFRYNDLNWAKKIEPLRYQESRKQFIEDMESVGLQASELFFNLLLAQINFEIAQTSLANTDTLYKISVGRFNLGKIAENDLLQMELGLMNSRNNVAQGELDVQLGTLRLRNFLNLKGNEEIILIEPTTIPEFNIDLQQAISEARANRKQMLEFERYKLEADRDVARAKGENRLNANLVASYGLTQSAILAENAYIEPLDQQRLQVGFQIPIVDWGRARSQIRTAEANRELVELNVSQAEQNFEQEIILLTTQFAMYREKLKIAIQSDTIAQKRLEISMQRYLIGKIGILDLNVALDERIQAKRSYVNALRDFWTSYYDLRRKTLFDFEMMREIIY